MQQRGKSSVFFKNPHNLKLISDLTSTNVDKHLLFAFKIALLAHKAVMGIAPMYLQEFFRFAHHGHSLKLIVIVPNVASSSGLRAFDFAGPKFTTTYQSPDSVEICYTDDMFKTALETFLFNLMN